MNESSFSSDLIYLPNKMPRYGQHSGYELLASNVRVIHPRTQLIAPARSLINRLIGKLYSTYHGWPARDQVDAASEFQLSLALKQNPDAAAHILYVEYHLDYLATLSGKAPRRLLATIHEPMARWTSGQFSIESLKRLSSAIVMYQSELDFFESIVGRGRVMFVPHGVDTDFFQPAADGASSGDNLVFAGVHLRNFGMLKRVILRLTERHPTLHFHLIVVEEARGDPSLKELSQIPSISWHNRITDYELRDIYQKSYLALLPINDGGANNSVVEALSCGLPLVTTDCAGIRDYGGGSIFPVVQNNNDDAMIDLVEKYLSSRQWRNEVSLQCRDFALKNLSWPLIARRHLEIYRTLASSA